MVEVIPQCSMKKFYFVEQGQKYDALRFLEDNGIYSIYMDNELWIAVNQSEPNYESAKNRMELIAKGLV